MVIPYYFYYLLIVVPPFLIKNKDRLLHLTNNLILISIVGYLFYYFWPISSTEILFQVNDNILSGMHTLITFDYLHQNAFPSMHVAVSFLIGYVLIDESPKFKFLIKIIIASIFFATFFIKQHYIVDSIAGLFLGYLGILNYKRIVFSLSSQDDEKF